METPALALILCRSATGVSAGRSERATSSAYLLARAARRASERIPRAIWPGVGEASRLSPGGGPDSPSGAGLLPREESVGAPGKDGGGEGVRPPDWDGGGRGGPGEGWEASLPVGESPSDKGGDGRGDGPSTGLAPAAGSSAGPGVGMGELECLPEPPSLLKVVAAAAAHAFQSPSPAGGTPATTASVMVAALMEARSPLSGRYLSGTEYRPGHHPRPLGPARRDPALPGMQATKAIGPTEAKHLIPKPGARGTGYAVRSLTGFVSPSKAKRA